MGRTTSRRSTAEEAHSPHGVRASGRQKPSSSKNRETASSMTAIPWRCAPVTVHDTSSLTAAAREASASRARREAHGKRSRSFSSRRTVLSNEGSPCCHHDGVDRLLVQQELHVVLLHYR